MTLHQFGEVLGGCFRLTAEGVALTDELIAVHLDNQRRLLFGLGEDERAGLAGLLERLALTLTVSDD